MDGQRQDLIIGKEDGIVEIYTVAEDDTAILVGVFVSLFVDIGLSFFRMPTSPLRASPVAKLAARHMTRSSSARARVGPSISVETAGYRLGVLPLQGGHHDSGHFRLFQCQRQSTTTTVGGL